MDRKELKAIVMGLVSMNGNSMNINDMMMGYIEANAEKILEICEIPKEKPKSKK